MVSASFGGMSRYLERHWRLIFNVNLCGIRMIWWHFGLLGKHWRAILAMNLRGIRMIWCGKGLGLEFSLSVVGPLGP